MELSNWMMGVVLTVYFAELVFPPITTVFNSGWVCIGCFFLWFILSLLKDRDYYRYIKPKVLVAFIFYFATSFLPYLFGNAVIAHRYMALALVPLGYSIYTYHADHGQRAMITSVLKITAVLSTVTALITASALFSNPYISRSIKSSGDASNSLAARGVGGYSFIYFVAIVSIILVHLFLVEKRSIKKTLYFLLALLSVVLIVMSSYMTALLILLVEVAVYFFVKLKKKSKKNALVFLAACVMIGVLVYLVMINQNRIIAMLPPRVAQIFSAGNSNAFTSILSEFSVDRFPRLQESFETFKKYPLFGLVGQGTVRYEGGYLTGFGQHSYIFDTFALYGLVLGVGAAFSCTIPFHRSERKVNDYSELTWAVLIGAALIYMLNNATESVGLAVGIIYPFVRDTYRTESQNEKIG